MENKSRPVEWTDLTPRDIVIASVSCGLVVASSLYVGVFIATVKKGLRKARAARKAES